MIKNGVLTRVQGFEIVNGHFDVPKNVTAIDNYAFNMRDTLTSITLPSEVTTIGHNAFANCTKLKSIVVPPAVTIIRALTFSGCNNLSSVILPPGVTSINAKTFAGCDCLKSITISGNIIAIAPDAFGENPSSLAQLSIIIDAKDEESYQRVKKLFAPTLQERVLSWNECCQVQKILIDTIAKSLPQIREPNSYISLLPVEIKNMVDTYLTNSRPDIMLQIANLPVTRNKEGQVDFDAYQENLAKIVNSVTNPSQTVTPSQAGMFATPKNEESQPNNESLNQKAQPK